jgi:hypothetical protein
MCMMLQYIKSLFGKNFLCQVFFYYFSLCCKAVSLHSNSFLGIIFTNIYSDYAYIVSYKLSHHFHVYNS